MASRIAFSFESIIPYGSRVTSNLISKDNNKDLELLRKALKDTNIERDIL